MSKELVEFFKALADSSRLKMAMGGFASVARGRAFFRNVQVRKIGWPTTVVKTQ